MSSTTGTSAKKRKADEISDDEGSAAEDVPHLPAPVWGGILDFMPYGEVRSALLVGKHIAVEAVKYVKTISVLKPSEMYVPATRRFPNIEEVRILCLLQGSGEFDDDDDGEASRVAYEHYTLSLETAYSATPFFTGFPKLKKAFIGGRLKYRHEHIYFSTFLAHYDDICSGPNNHEEIFRGLVMSLGGAFKTGLLSHDVTIQGVDHNNWSLVRPCHQSGERTETHSCSWCRNVVEQFPIPHILSEFRNGSVAYIENTCNMYCLKRSEFWAVLNRRPGGKQAILRASEEMLCGKLRGSLRDRSPKHVPPDVFIKNYTRLVVWSLSETSLSEIDEMIKAGFDPKRIRTEYLRSLFAWCFSSWEKHTLTAWTKSTVAELSSRGFPVDWITTVDDMHIRV